MKDLRYPDNGAVIRMYVRYGPPVRGGVPAWNGFVEGSSMFLKSAVKRGARPLLVYYDLKGPEVKRNLTIMTLGGFTNSFSLHPVDLFILGVFLVATLIVGLSYGRQVKTIQDYALGGKNFSTYTLVATVVATYASGSAFFVNIENTYISGLYFIIPLFVIPLHFWISSYMVMGMGEFMQHVSVAEAMGSMYGKTVQIITACSSIIARIGYIAVQFKATSKAIVLLFDIQDDWAALIAATITVLYSAFGGIRAVTFTDVTQFLTFSISLPVLALVVWNHLKNPGQITATLNNPIFDFGRLIVWDEKFRQALNLFLYFLLLGFSPELFQRTVMAKNVYQARRVLTYSALIYVLIILITVWIGILLLTDKPGLTQDQIINYMISEYAYIGIKGLLGAGVIALAMSTADSSMNSISVMFANDFVRPLAGHKHTSVMTARLFTVISGFSALLLALYSRDLLGAILSAASFYMPIYMVPFVMAILGFRTSKRAVLLSMATGFSTVILLSIFPAGSELVFGMLANLIMLLGSHYLLGEPGGWQKVAPDSPLGLTRAARQEAWQRRRGAIQNFRFYPYLQQFLPAQESVYTLLGIYAIVSTYLGLYTIEKADVESYQAIYKIIKYMVLWGATAFLVFPIWPSNFKNKRFLSFFWPLGMATILLFTGMLLVILSHFHPLQVLVLIMNFLLVALLLRWPLALLLTFISISSAALFFVQYTGEALRWVELGSVQFRFLYSFFVLTGLLLAFFAYQESYKRLGKKNEALQTREKDGQASLVRVATEKQAALAALQYTGVEKLLTITRELEAMHVTEEDKERMKALQTELLPIAFQLQGLNTRAQDYLRLQKADLPLKAWCNEIKSVVIEKGVTARMHCNNKSEFEQLNCDPQGLTSLIVNSIMLLNKHLESQALEDTPLIFFKIEDTRLSYPLEDVKPGYIKYVPAVRIAITVSDDLPVVKDSYSAELTGSSQPTSETTVEELARLANSRIVKSHYGYEEVTDNTFIYVVPVDVEDVRPKDMDKDYMEVGAMPKRANDHFRDEENGIDAQAQEAAFLADVAARSDANMNMVQTALEAIKWYHGPKNRNSGEPFYLHPLTVAHIVLDYNTDEETIIGALLHDTVEDTPMQLEHIEDRFGKATAEVVNVVTHLQSIPHSIYKIKMSASENLQMLERTGNKRGLYVKIADRMHNMRTIGGHSKVSKRKLIAQETADFFVPLARKLGLEEAAAEFEKMCLEVFKQKD